MSAFLSKYFTYIRTFIRISLIVLICFKTVTAVFSVAPSLKKEVFATEDENEKNAETKTEKTDSEKEKEFASIGVNNIYNGSVANIVIHKTVYIIHYQSANFANISIPPPDTSLLPLT